MSQQPPEFLPYATPTDEPTPTPVSVISIIGICLGGLTILGRLFGLTMAIFMRGMLGARPLAAGYSAFSILSPIIFLGFAGLLVAASIGCLQRREWGRVWLIRWAITYPIALVLETAGSLMVAMPAVTKVMATTPRGPGGTAVSDICRDGLRGGLANHNTDRAADTADVCSDLHEKAGCEGGVLIVLSAGVLAEVEGSGRGWSEARFSRQICKTNLLPGGFHGRFFDGF